MTEIITESRKYEEKLYEELNDLIECVLCPTDLMDTIDEYARLKIVEELESMKKENITISDKIKQLTEI